MTALPASTPSEVASRGLVSSPTTATRRAVLYLRVSSAGQVNTDYDPEGLSIPAQRQACERQVERMGDVKIVGEYVEPGRTATNVEGRPAFQAMMQRLKDSGDVDLVIVYKVSRLNRDWIQAATTIDKIQKRGARIVSATENIDDTPAGQLTLGLLSAVNAFRSAEDGADIRYKLGEKAKRGGTIGYAPLGYLNVREKFEGRNVAIVVPDPERAPLVQQAFDLFATGQYTVRQLRAEMTARGLRTRPGKHPARPPSEEALRRMLTNRYYLGKLLYNGEEYDGRHPALVTDEVFGRVQEVIASRRHADERRRIHHHYLKGILWCGDCQARGQSFRLVLTMAKGNGGHYRYFFCRGRQDHQGCTAPFLPVEDVEEAIAQHYATLRFDADLIEKVTASVKEVLADEHAATRLARDQARTELARLDVREENLLDLAADGDLPQAKIRQRLRDIEAQRAAIRATEERASTELAAGAELVDTVLALLSNPEHLYRRSTDAGRRMLDQAIFKRLYLTGEAVRDDLREPFASFVSVGREAAATATGARHEERPTKVGRCDRRTATPTDLLQSIVFGPGLSKRLVVGAAGFEPTTFRV